MLLYTGIYNPNSLPVKHYRFRLDFNFWRIIALAHIRMSLQYAERQQQHRDRQRQGQLSHRAPAGTPGSADAPGLETVEDPKSPRSPGEVSNPWLGA